MISWIVAAILWALLIGFIVLFIRCARQLTELEHDAAKARQQLVHLQALLQELHHEILKDGQSEPLTAVRMAYRLRKIFRAAGIPMGET